MQIKKWPDTFAYDETSKRKLEFPMKYDAKNPAFIRSDVLRIVLFKVMHTKCKSKRWKYDVDMCVICMYFWGDL